MLDLKLGRQPVTPKDAATIVLVRDGTAGGLEVLCVERSQQSRFLGGAVVFPGGKLDDADTDEDWDTRTTRVRTPEGPMTVPFTRDAEHLRALAVAACREMLEEAAILHVAGPTPVAPPELVALRTSFATNPKALRAFLDERSLKLDLEALHPLARWITPEAEARRYDARFFIAVAPDGQTGVHDARETTASFWVEPAEILRRWEAGRIQLAPPTHRTLMILAACATSSDALSLARSSCLDPICPRLVPQKLAEGTETMALTLPGDPEHEVETARVPGPSRYVRRGGRWVAEDAPR